jgi:hypothetical protein
LCTGGVAMARDLAKNTCPNSVTGLPQAFRKNFRPATADAQPVKIRQNDAGLNKFVIADEY